MQPRSQGSGTHKQISFVPINHCDENYNSSVSAMLALDDYGSEDSSDNDIANKAEKKTVEVSHDKTVAVQGNQAPKGKKRKLDISFLPKNIQDALTQGGLNDSDDEDSNQYRDRHHKSNGSSSNNNNNSRSSLLDMLPKPKGFTDSKPLDDKKVSVTVSNPPANIGSFKGPVPARAAKGSVETTSGPLFSWQIENEESDDEIRNETGIQTEESIKLPQIDDPKLTGVSLDQTGIGFTSTSKDAALSSSYVDFLPNGYDHSLDGYIGPAAYPPQYAPQDDSAANTNSRKRDREIEAQLLQGNVGVIETLSARTVHANKAWDSETYNSQIERERELKSIYHLDSEGVNQPTKLQNRRHQINSLAFKAAETELALLDARTNRLRTKAETQGKYGW